MFRLAAALPVSPYISLPMCLLVAGCCCCCLHVIFHLRHFNFPILYLSSTNERTTKRQTKRKTKYRQLNAEWTTKSRSRTRSLTSYAPNVCSIVPKCKRFVLIVYFLAKASTHTHTCDMHTMHAQHDSVHTIHKMKGASTVDRDHGTGAGARMCNVNVYFKFGLQIVNERCRKISHFITQIHV